MLIEGESGSGKEVIARAIHGQSGRSGAFVPVNCGALPDNLVESELFGYKKGAFSGAQSRSRRASCARPTAARCSSTRSAICRPSSQAALLRVLQEREVMPVGGTRAVAIDLRVVAATHRDLDDMVAEGSVPSRSVRAARRLPRHGAAARRAPRRPRPADRRAPRAPVPRGAPGLRHRRRAPAAALSVAAQRPRARAGARDRAGPRRRRARSAPSTCPTRSAPAGRPARRGPSCSARSIRRFAIRSSPRCASTRATCRRSPARSTRTASRSSAGSSASGSTPERTADRSPATPYDPVARCARPNSWRSVHAAIRDGSRPCEPAARLGPRRDRDQRRAAGGRRSGRTPRAPHAPRLGELRSSNAPREVRRQQGRGHRLGDPAERRLRGAAAPEQELPHLARARRDREPIATRTSSSM